MPPSYKDCYRGKKSPEALRTHILKAFVPNDHTFMRLLGYFEPQGRGLGVWGVGPIGFRYDQG